MSDTITASRVEPIVDPGPGPDRQTPPSFGPAPMAPPSFHPPEAASVGPAVVGQDHGGERPSSLSDQLSRLEDKTARIEEKLARSEAATQRVVDRFEAASHRMSEVAQQSDLVATRGDAKFIARRVRALPGFSALVLTSIITAVLTAVLVIAIMRYLPGVLGR
ncbi:hypothetical protein [uncultured Enterovirga sp.]|uniref:hypothetical protein n=1 Tax=uncultured Enterovirga sp. TaxID=2026352 RepID=UPI0035CC6D80